jgi:hypothetical protein
MTIFTWALLAVSFALLAFNQRGQHNTDQKLRHSVALNKATLEMLCDRAAIIEDVVDAGVAITEIARKDPKFSPEIHRADDVFIQRLEEDKRLLVRQTTNPLSPCVKVQK